MYTFFPGSTSTCHGASPGCRRWRRRAYIEQKVKWPPYRPCVAQRVGRGIALLFHNRGTGRGWVVSNIPRPHFTLWKDPVPILQEDGWAPGPVWTGGKSRPHRDSIADRPARSQSLYRLSYPAHYIYTVQLWIYWISSHEQPIRDGPSGLGMGEGPKNASP